MKKKPTPRKRSTTKPKRTKSVAAKTINYSHYGVEGYKPPSLVQDSLTVPCAPSWSMSTYSTAWTDRRTSDQKLNDRIDGLVADMQRRDALRRQTWHYKLKLWLINRKHALSMWWGALTKGSKSKAVDVNSMDEYDDRYY